ncbi:transcription elongation factor S-II [Thecamonas trahens ATCC 50062]|uniref:Transcription elongation factor S-II n=1 Tax=Thecamonas trahens ATCC 50062 TaxID=461836 RepID=A0A0L0D448_THETB|nr:transcription elongation factor S-II [Thecamonas trahens ATCC 50062]KNC46881.1 transcription elongation factor S-II [Thecamonas trahens ATCC 50062]|eukprot:XP_013760154.1 transcription elongation factor S-II [Thecamonas trahens ATCC 50062]
MAKSGTVATVMGINMDLKSLVSDATAKERVLDMLVQLESEPVTVEVLKKTKVGHTVNMLRKHEVPEVRTKAKRLLASWRAMYSGSKSPATPPGQKSFKRMAPPASAKVAAAKPEAGAEAKPASKVRADNKAVSSGTYATTGVRARDFMRKLFFEGLGKTAEGGQERTPAEVAVAIEEAMFAAEGEDVTADYKRRGRAIAAVLRDEKNPLPLQLLQGSMSTEMFMGLSDEDLVNPDVRDTIKAAKIQGDKDMAMAEVMAETDMFKCGKCKERKCTYYQLQTRSADEPMTVFVTCTNCGNKWRC